MSAHRIAPLLLALAATAIAKTDLAGCTSFTTTTSVLGGSAPFQTVMWYDPDSLEICSFIDCGGGRAPPKTDRPGCPLYTGTEAAAVDFLATDPAAPPPVTSSPTPTDTERGGTSSPRPTGPPEEDGDEGTSTIEAVSETETDAGVTQSTAASETGGDAAATDSKSRTELVVAPEPTPSAPTDASASVSTSADPSSTGAADALRGGPGVLLAAGLAAIAAM
jgi:hypothetical protein